jgi:hypothetical protein
LGKKTVILPDLVLPSRINYCCEYSGLDSLENCLDPEHFKNYPHAITYNFNSRGFRDQEWTESLEELKNAWPWLLAQITQQRTINVSMDGASNAWIARCARLISQIQPKNLVVMWSYLHRRETASSRLSSEQRRLHFEDTSVEQDIEYFKSAVDQVNNSYSHAVHLTIPRFSPFYEIIPDINDVWQALTGSTIGAPKCRQDLLNTQYLSLKTKSAMWEKLENLLNLKEVLDQSQITQVYNLDYARDGHHFDCVTAQWVVDQITDQLT